MDIYIDMCMTYAVQALEAMLRCPDGSGLAASYWACATEWFASAAAVLR